MKIIPLKYDFCVKEVTPIFGAENETVRKHFISDVLNIPLRDIKSVRILNPFLWKRYKKRKLGSLRSKNLQMQILSQIIYTIAISYTIKSRNWAF